MKIETEYFERNYCDNFDLIINSFRNNKIIDLYVDGSYNDKIFKYSYAFSVVKEGVVIYTETGVSNSQEIAQFGSVGAEIYSAMKAIEFAYKYNLKNINIIYDYVGIRDFALNRNKKIPLASYYYDYFKMYTSKMMVNFTKIKGHGENNFHNDIDKLSRKSLHK